MTRTNTSTPFPGPQPDPLPEPKPPDPVPDPNPPSPHPEPEPMPVPKIGGFLRTLLPALLVFTSFTSLAASAQADAPADSEITNAVKAELRVSDVTTGHPLTVETVDGIVQLQGTVSNLLAKERAVRVSRTIRGVRGIVDLIRVEPPQRDDQAIELDVEAALHQDPATESFEVDAKVQHADVTLTGVVDSWAEKELCLQVAKSVRGVHSVTDNIEIAFADTPRPDNEIADEVRRLLKNDVWIDDALLTVEVQDGVVKISGEVSSDAQRERVRRAAAVSGVRNVNTEMLEASWAADDAMRRNRRFALLDEEQVVAAVRDAVHVDPRVSTAGIAVHAARGTITLKGEVDNLKAKGAAEQDARNASGHLWKVNSEIQLRGGGRRTAEQIEQENGNTPNASRCPPRAEQSCSRFGSCIRIVAGEAA